MQKAKKWQEYLAQAARFAELSRLATEHATQAKKKLPPDSTQTRNFETFEAVAIGVCHGFALEMLIKGIREKRNLPFVREHNLCKLMNTSDFRAAKQIIEEKFDDRYSGCNHDYGFKNLMKGTAELFADYRYHFEGKTLPMVNSDFTSFLYLSLRSELESNDA